ncbi:30S ribosomal protein S20 [Candidatus Uhrbacteria bacterium CG_4_9_14_0_2_um_filter_41_50]|uniref:Small ribosomal subunit protein bS20 n=1 Tax=Candidatus Uhrbacteria bacterium CG_4_9_14_0_2_um_filter_41_50 TaxID=1975031 RepID=A0A2M8EN36_9BACT|nr:MAG: 30S ribosomal protein S20 [Candidatus Uhrbacteria bacterium CG_4_10_14_3_um_filter_41_21]PIZ55164.1 MAG: 30S ribosomal protein S20 [Candidatus Uhrbacteria bacterium CG_4_10_14_0_2_um_filter_41_21]PJB84871.1 MAG: 30S ribosomal protein S20 [Candidatus Uhrbacteria bacterium CG_4_9_14_0_8_um_filter_41_16]PJC24131.1 MAG: 30S ribosomal protein S20 [Candidatus Uhrbacteria bacterium CG_4_9_14_0_2_um_filter_41_50]PJE75020.1 MAG: 30S ribosomal protein S20 [Candidatus Uhrbacteria bacterium CG10_bi
MPQLAHAKKALRQSIKRFEANKIVRAEIDSMRRHFRKLLEAKNIDEAKAIIPELQQKLDKAVVKNIYKQNKSARIISRMSAALAKTVAK